MSVFLSSICLCHWTLSSEDQVLSFCLSLFPVTGLKSGTYKALNKCLTLKNWSSSPSSKVFNFSAHQNHQSQQPWNSRSVSWEGLGMCFSRALVFFWLDACCPAVEDLHTAVAPLAFWFCGSSAAWVWAIHSCFRKLPPRSLHCEQAFVTAFSPSSSSHEHLFLLLHLIGRGNVPRDALPAGPGRTPGKTPVAQDLGYQHRAGLFHRLGHHWWVPPTSVTLKQKLK